eukprot:4142672-Pyramimonas_sp.AAC.2
MSTKSPSDTVNRAQEEDFKAFCEQPENKKQMVLHQQSEMRKAQRLQRKMKALVCSSAVSLGGYRIEQTIAQVTCWKAVKWSFEQRQSDPTLSPVHCTVKLQLLNGPKTAPASHRNSRRR